MDVSIDFREENILPKERFLFIDALLEFEFPKSVNELRRDRYPKRSDEEFCLIQQEFKSFIREYDNPNLISVGMFMSYANINLPKTYEIIFDINDKSRYWEQKVIVKYAYNYRDIFHADLWKGHSSHIIIEVIGKPPVLFNELNVNYKSKSKTLIGLCSKFDWEFIKNISNKSSE